MSAKVVEFKDWRDPHQLGHRWEISAENGVKATIWKGDNSRTYRVTVMKVRVRADGLLSAQAIALEMLGVLRGNK